MQPCQVFGVLWPVLFTCRHGFQFPFIYSKYCITQFKKHKFTWSIIIRQYIHCIRWSLISMKWKNLLCFPHNHTMHIIWLQTFGMIVLYFFNWPWNYYYSVQRKITNKLFIVPLSNTTFSEIFPFQVFYIKSTGKQFWRSEYYPDLNEIFVLTEILRYQLRQCIVEPAWNILGNLSAKKCSLFDFLWMYRSISKAWYQTTCSRAH